MEASQGILNALHGGEGVVDVDATNRRRGDDGRGRGGEDRRNPNQQSASHLTVQLLMDQQRVTIEALMAADKSDIAALIGRTPQQAPPR